MVLEVGSRVEGLEVVLGNINREIERIESATMGGLLAGGLIVQAQAQRWTPVERGNLRASAYTRKDPMGRLQVEVGYEAAYALFVHENLEMKLKGRPRPSGLGVYWGPKGRAKFLEQALVEKQNEVIKTIAKRVNRGD